MKKIFGILCLITLSLAGVSCHGDLDIAQKGQVTGGDAWGSQSNALANMYGMMSTFRGLRHGLYVLGRVPHADLG